MKVFETHKELYYMEIESDSIEYDSLYDTSEITPNHWQQSPYSKTN